MHTTSQVVKTSLGQATVKKGGWGGGKRDSFSGDLITETLHHV